MDPEDISLDPVEVKGRLASFLESGVIIDVANAEEAKLAEEAGVAAVMVVDDVQPNKDLPLH